MTRYKAKECFVYRKIMEDEFLVPIGKQSGNRNGIVMLNETAAFLWNEIQTEKTLGELCAALSENYASDGEEVREDVKQFLETMLSLGAVTEE